MLPPLEVCNQHCLTPPPRPRARSATASLRANNYLCSYYKVIVDCNSVRFVLPVVLVFYLFHYFFFIPAIKLGICICYKYFRTWYILTPLYSCTVFPICFFVITYGNI